MLLIKTSSIIRFSCNMKKTTAIICLLSIVFALSAQTTPSISPYSFNISKTLLAPLVTTQLQPLNITEAERLDKIDAKTGELPKFSRSIYTNLNLDNSGSWSDLPDGSRLWQLQVTAKGALGLIPFFNKLYIPKGAYLHVYMPGKEEVIGAFTFANNPADGFYCTGLIHGETFIIEYYEPAEVKGQGYLNINEVGYAYRWVSSLHKDARDFGDASSCEVNVNCGEGGSYQNQKRAVVRILVQSSQGQGWCSGALVNNVRQDCTPYLLSAQHCSEGTTTNQYSQWVFYFNYESPNCSNPPGQGTLGNQTVIGCTKKADSNDNGGDSGSDFLLLQLNNTPPVVYNAFLAGWDNSATAATAGVGIHHPGGDIKKISTYTSALQSTSWGGSVSNTHWSVTWAATINGHGVTEPGSSGSPLFNTQGQIVGTLTGGDSYCSTPNAPDAYGKVAYDWTLNGAAANRQLKAWLDPDNTGTTSLGGSNFPCGTLPVNDAGISSITSPNGSVCAQTLSPVVILQNYGSSPLISATIHYTIDASSYQYNWTGSLTTYATQSVTVPAVPSSAGAHTITAYTTNPNNSTDGNTANDLSTNNFTGIQGEQLNFYLKTDDYGSETSWEIKDNSNNTLYTGGPYNDVAIGETFNIPICLSAGCYTLTLYDSYGDGLNGTTFNGDMKLTGNNGNTTYAQLANPDFGSQKTYNFCVQSTGISTVSDINIRVSPNPSAGVFNIMFDNNDTKHIMVYNAIGSLVFNNTTTDLQTAINLNSQSAGVYILQIETPMGKALKKLVLK